MENRGNFRTITCVQTRLRGEVMVLHPSPAFVHFFCFFFRFWVTKISASLGNRFWAPPIKLVLQALSKKVPFFEPEKWQTIRFFSENCFWTWLNTKLVFFEFENVFSTALNQYEFNSFSGPRNKYKMGIVSYQTPYAWNTLFPRRCNNLNSYGFLGTEINRRRVASYQTLYKYELGIWTIINTYEFI